ncbi:MAG: sel1 repeat family protein [Alphaproteobacteria bacterium]|nr:sel1 repeat family protein [Alphaproteobacteria bacterium]
MRAKNVKYWLYLGVACVALSPVTATAEMPEVTHKPLNEEVLMGDMPQDYKYTGNENVGGELLKRQRVESRVKAYKEQLHTDDAEHLHEENMVSPEQFKDLVARAQKGDAIAIGAVAYSYQNGLGGNDKNEKKAIEWYKSAIEHGKTEHFSTIGKMYLENRNEDVKPGFFDQLRNKIAGEDETTVEDDDEKARKWFEQGVYAKDFDSYMQLGMMYRDGAGGLPKDMEKAKWYYDEGLRYKKVYDERMMAQAINAARKQAEAEESIVQSKAPPRPADPNVKEFPGVVLGESYCTLREMGSPTTHYKQFYEAYCGGIEEDRTETVPAKARVKGMDCEITKWPENKAGKDFELRCK